MRTLVGNRLRNRRFDQFCRMLFCQRQLHVDINDN